MKRTMLLFMLSMALGTAAQTNIKLVSGNVYLDNVKLPPNVYIPLENLKTVTVKKGSRAMVYTRDKLVELENAASDKTYKIADIQSKVAKAAKLSMPVNAKGFAECIARNNKMMRVEQHSDGASLAGTDGLNPEGATKKETVSEEYFFPADSSLVLVESVQLKWNSNKNFNKPEIWLINESTKDTVGKYPDLKIPGAITVKLPKPGNYKWILVSMAGKRIKITNRFRKASGSEEQQARKDLAAFEKAIARFSPETKAALLADYKSKIVE